MVIRIRQEEGDKLRLLIPHPKERRKRVKVVIGQWDDELKKLAKKSDILVLAKGHELKSSERKGAFLVKGPGEYEINGIFVKGVPDSGDAPIYTIRGEGARACYLHHVPDEELGSETLEMIGEVDVLLCFLNGEGLPSPKSTKKIMAQIDPSIVVFFKKKKVKKKELEKFLKSVDVKNFEEEDDLIFNKSDFKESKTQFFVLKGG